MARGKGRPEQQLTQAFSSVMGVKRGSDRPGASDASLYREEETVTEWDEDCEEVTANVVRYYRIQGGPLHRDEGPAVEWSDGYREWWKDGELHRDDGPAIERVDGIKLWYQHGTLSRVGGPAIEHWNGSRIWVRDGKLHRTDGPAIERRGNIEDMEDWENNQRVFYLGPYGETSSKQEAFVFLDECGEQEWWLDGQRRRDDGPSVITDRGTLHEWRIGGELHREDGPALLRYDRAPTATNDALITYEEWYKHGKEHRVGGPACTQRSKEGVEIELWYQDGEPHRDDGPAVDFGNTGQWWQRGRRHRLDGPAVVEKDTEIWYLNGVVHREDGPAIDSKEYKVRVWVQNGQLHRALGPAIEWNADLDLHDCVVQSLKLRQDTDHEDTVALDIKNRAQKEWWLDGKLHREDGPARIFIKDGEVVGEEWYEHGQKLDPPPG